MTTLVPAVVIVLKRPLAEPRPHPVPPLESATKQLRATTEKTGYPTKAVDTPLSFPTATRYSSTNLGV